MDLDRETAIEVAVSVTAVLLFVALLLWIGRTYGAGSFSSTGGLALVGAIVFFIVAMTGVGIALAYVLNPTSEPDDDA